MVEEWRHIVAEDARIGFLLNAYVRQMLTRKIKNYSYKSIQPNTRQTKVWLIWLSRRLQKESKTPFLIEELQPYLLEREKRIKYASQYRFLGIGAYVVPGIIIIFVGFSLGIELFEGIISFISGIIFAILCLLSFWHSWMTFYTKNLEIIDFKLSENLVWSLEKARISLLSDKLELVAKLLGSASVTAFFLFKSQLLVGFGNLILWSILHIYFAGISSGSEITIKTIPNQCIFQEYNRFKNKCIRLYVIFSISSIFIFIIYLISTDYITIFKMIISLFMGFLLGGLITLLALNIYIFLWVIFGKGKPCIQHFFLRYTLFKSGDIPWNYAKFLDYATERLFLQRIGGRYRFIHRMLQDHFSKMFLEGEGE